MRSTYAEKTVKNPALTRMSYMSSQRRRRETAKPRVQAAEQPEPWVKDELSVKPCNGGTKILFRAYSALCVAIPKPRACALGFAISRFQRFGSRFYLHPRFSVEFWLSLVDDTENRIP